MLHYRQGLKPELGDVGMRQSCKLMGSVVRDLFVWDDVPGDNRLSVCHYTVPAERWFRQALIIHLEK